MTDDELDRPLTTRGLREELMGRHKVGLTPGTWAALVGAVIGILTIGVAVAEGYFVPRADAHDDHEIIELRQEAKIEKEVGQLEVKVQKNTDRWHSVDKKITIIGQRMGAGRDMRKVDEDLE